MIASNKFATQEKLNLERMIKEELRKFNRTGQIYTNVFQSKVLFVDSPNDGYWLRDNGLRRRCFVYHKVVWLDNDVLEAQVHDLEEIYYGDEGDLDFSKEWSRIV